MVSRFPVFYFITSKKKGKIVHADANSTKGYF